MKANNTKVLGWYEIVFLLFFFALLAGIVMYQFKGTPMRVDVLDLSGSDMTTLVIDDDYLVFITDREREANLDLKIDQLTEGMYMATVIGDHVWLTDTEGKLPRRRLSRSDLSNASAYSTIEIGRLLK